MKTIFILQINSSDIHKKGSAGMQPFQQYYAIYEISSVSAMAFANSAKNARIFIASVRDDLHLEHFHSKFEL